MQTFSGKAKICLFMEGVDLFFSDISEFIVDVAPSVAVSYSSSRFLSFLLKRSSLTLTETSPHTMSRSLTLTPFSLCQTEKYESCVYHMIESWFSLSNVNIHKYFEEQMQDIWYLQNVPGKTVARQLYNNLFCNWHMLM